jgi:cold shock CspA family protein
MGRSQETFNKKELQKKKAKKKKEKAEKRQARKDQEKRSGLDDMIAYVDEHGVISSTPPDEDKKEEIKLEDIEVGVPERNKEEDPIREGRVEFFNDSKGYGFIRDNQTRESIFVHLNNTLDDIKEGDSVIFEITKGPKGMLAEKVKLNKPN